MEELIPAKLLDADQIVKVWNDGASAKIDSRPYHQVNHSPAARNAADNARRATLRIFLEVVMHYLNHDGFYTIFLDVKQKLVKFQHAVNDDHTNWLLVTLGAAPSSSSRGDKTAAAAAAAATAITAAVTGAIAAAAIYITAAAIAITAAVAAAIRAATIAITAIITAAAIAAAAADETAT
ncbi:unnamed protein product [Tilletia controversa]|nr:unnamed protein product [Tilletia controversa]